MPTSKLSKLQKAKIVQVDKNGNSIENPYFVDCHFNPYEYTISKSCTYNDSSKLDSDTTQREFVQSNPQTLSLSLIFDTYESGEDVSEKTKVLWYFMGTKIIDKKSKTEKSIPPYVAFEWGVFRFVACITSMTQRFILFKNDGTPVRAKVDVTFTQDVDVEDYRPKPQNPTSGNGSPDRVWRVSVGDRLDTIAASVYGDAYQWRRIAEHNHIGNPLAVHPGQQLLIPFD